MAQGDLMKTNANTLEPLAQSALLAVYELGSAERPAHVSDVARQLAVSHTEATRLLYGLDRAGLLWAERCRLTMPGLALAVRLWSQRARARRSAA
jgi:Mn-dependent DtxR family transcriptional regulator